jgi:adenine deaminase
VTVSGNIVDVANADMSLPVISKLKLTDRGLFNVEKFEYLNGIGTSHIGREAITGPA